MSLKNIEVEVSGNKVLITIEAEAWVNYREPASAVLATVELNADELKQHIENLMEAGHVLFLGDRSKSEVSKTY